MSVAGISKASHFLGIFGCLYMLFVNIGIGHTTKTIYVERTLGYTCFARSLRAIFDNVSPKIWRHKYHVTSDIVF